MVINMAETRTYEIRTSLTLEDYRQLVWGIERIVLDSISNHLPADSNGTTTSVKLKQDSVYVDWKEADKTKETTEVVFEDNGSGYDAGLLSVLFSPKAGDPLSVGQFGEGLKRIAMAALREGLDVEYRSRNWRAKPFTTKESIGRHNISRLCFRVTENGDQLEGSRTVFTNPSRQLVDEVFQLPQKVLALNSNYRELHNERDNVKTPDDIFLSFIETHFAHNPSLISNDHYQGMIPKARYHSRIIEMADDSQALFVKGVRIQGIDALFSYDLGIEDISPDRMFAHTEKALDAIEFLLKGCSNTAVIERILQEAESNPYRTCYEFRAFAPRGLERKLGGIYEERNYKEIDPGMSRTQNSKFLKKLEKPNLWVTTFKQLYGENALLASENTNANNDATLLGYRPVRLNVFIGKYLRNNGLKSVDEITKDVEYHWVNRDELTDEERAMIARTDEINVAVLEERIFIDVRVYTGLFTKTGREVSASLGAYITEGDGTKYIGIKRSQLSGFRDFSTTYIHELGHYVTEAGDADRRFTEFFVTALSRMIELYTKKG